MLKSMRKIRGARRSKSIIFEALETRQLLSVSLLGQDGPGGQGGPPPRGPGGPGGPGGGGPGGPASTIEFSLAPTAVQSGLDALATADGLTDPTSTQLVSLNNVNGVETYSVTIDGTGTVSRLTVDQNGVPVTQPTQSTTTWATLDGTGTGSDAAAATEISTIATALSLTAPTATTVININTTATGVVTYSLKLSSSSSSSDSTDTEYMPADLGINVIVDAAGNPVGNQRLPFSVLPSAIQTALNNNAPTGATALAGTSTQSVDIRNVDGVQTYTVPFTVSGTTTAVTVNLTGDLVSLPSTSTTTFADLSSIVQTELQTLATADGVTGTISSTQSVTVLTETNGTVLYSITVSVDGADHTYDITLTVDADGNPTTLPMDPGGGPPPQADPGGSGDGDDDGDSDSGSSGSGSGSSGDSGSGAPVACPPDDSGSSGSSGSGDSSSGSGDSSSDSGDSGGTVSTPISLGNQSSSRRVSSPAVYGMTAKILAGATDGLGALAGLFVQFIPADADSAVQADLTKLHSDIQQSASDLKGLSSAERTTLHTDLAGIQSAIKGMSATLSPLQATFKTDAATWNATLRADKKAIRADQSDSTALAAAKAKLATDQAASFTALAGDAVAILTAINGNSGVEAAQQQLATDLPTIAADQTTVSGDVTQLVTDIESQLSAE